MPLTYTGRNVDCATGHPSLIDIAVGLSRMPRFAGQTERWFSVLDHSLFVESLVDDDGPHPAMSDPPAAHDVSAEVRRLLRIALLLHDAHESLTGDVPTPLKPRELSTIQQALDIGIMEAFMPGGRRAFYDLHEAVKVYDRRAVGAEALFLLGLKVNDYREAFYITEATQADVVELSRLIGRGVLGVPPTEMDPFLHPTVQRYLTRMLELL